MTVPNGIYLWRLHITELRTSKFDRISNKKTDGDKFNEIVFKTWIYVPIEFMSNIWSKS